jgi:hypothetical protein
MYAKKILLYHLYPINNWKEITDGLLRNIPHNKVFVHISIPVKEEKQAILNEIKLFFNKYKYDISFVSSKNSVHPEVDAILSFVEKRAYIGYEILTYMHSKGVSKPENSNIKDWVEMMRYFIIDRMDICEKAFMKGYVTYGVNKSLVYTENPGFINSTYFYEGNFVSINLTKIKDFDLQVIKKIEKEYHGLEGFWGKLCKANLAYSPFNSGVNHYLSPFPEKIYKVKKNRVYHNISRFYYNKIRKILRFTNSC